MGSKILTHQQILSLDAPACKFWRALPISGQGARSEE